MRTRAQAVDTSALDVAYLATTFGAAELEIQTLIDAPTAELVREFLASLTKKTEEYDAIKAEKLKADVELENTVRTSEAKVKAQKSAVVKAQKEVEELRTKLDQSDAAREALAAELEHLKSSTTGSGLETQALRQRIDTLEASNRDALSLLESKSTEKDRLAAELSEQHSKLLALRREISQLEEKNQALENAAASQKFKEQSLQQELELLRKNNEWHSNELQTRSQEHTKFRKERNTRISSLERELEESNATVDALKRTEATLRQRLDEVQAKAEEAFSRVASLQEEAARTEQGFRKELDGCKRLAELQAQNANTHKARLQEVQMQLDQIKDDAAEEIGRLQAEIETERGDKGTAERSVAELELKIEHLEQQPRVSKPGTPVRNGEPQTPSRFGSPLALPGSVRKVVNGLSFTQLYTKYTQTQEELENERRRTEKLSTALDELVTELETRKPEIEDLKEDQERLESEVLNFSRLLDEANETRNTAVRDARRWQSEAEVAFREGHILRQQLRDLSTQVKILLVEIQSRNQGLSELSAEERMELERAARGELDDATLDEMTNTGRLISERLVIFRRISDLQSQNEKLLRLTRELGDKMEGEEAREQARQHAADAQEVEELRRHVDRYKDELQTTATQIDSYMKERDMFRRMLQHRGQLAPDTDLQSMFGQSIQPATPHRNGSVGPPGTPRSKDIEDLNKLLKEQQAFFDQYRNESSTDRRVLKEQVDALAREKGNLQADLARAQSQVALASERYEMLRSNFNALRNENSELQKRSQQMAEQATKQDLRTQQVAEDLVEARSIAESLRNENANYKAEKELWKRIEARLNEENRSLLDDRSRLNKLVTNLQNLQNERELAESDNRRRLQSRMETLESDLAETKKKLESEVEGSRKAALRREYEEGQSRTRIDDLVKSLSNVREELVVAKTTRDQLQTRVDELKIELRSADEKVLALQPRPTTRSEPAQQNPSGAGNELPTEQRLALELSDLRRNLELSKAELESARQQVEQFRSIAQTTEEELANFSQTTDQYKEDTDRLIAEKDAKISELEKRVEDLTTEMSTTNEELSELRSKAEDSSRLLAEQKASFEAVVGRLRDDVDRLESDKVTIQDDVKAQAEIAQQAQSSYEEELLKHAEAAKSLQSVRKEYNELRTEIAGARAEAEAAKTSLERSEESWAEQREQFERELEEVKKRRQDADEQNRLLHQQMEAFSNELAALRQGRASAAGLGENGGHEHTQSATVQGGNLQEVINFLRREKDIVDVQYELSTQEAKRLQQQLDYANFQLEETRQKLSDERRQSAEKSSHESSTNKLMQTINELNLYRESATTLRNEARVAREKLEEKSQEVELLLAEIDPLKARVGELEGELESKIGEIKLLQDDRDHWRERTQNIISKYDRVDPAELEEMKKKLEELEAEKARLQGEVDGFDARLEQEADTQKAEAKKRMDNFANQAKDRDRLRRKRIEEVTEEKEAVAQQLQILQGDLVTATTALGQTKAELEQVKLELKQTKVSLEQASTKAPAASDDDIEEGQVEEDGTAARNNDDHAALYTRVAEAEASASEHASRAEALDSEVQALRSRVQELEGQVSELQQQLESEKAVMGREQTEQTAPTSGNSEFLEKLKQDLSIAQQEVETLRASAPAGPSDFTLVNAQPGIGERSVADQVAEEVAKLRSELEQQHELAKAQVDERANKRVENLRQQLQQKLNESKAKVREEIRQELQEQHETEIQRIKEDHNALIDKLRAEHQEELDRLTKEGDDAVERARSAAADVKPEEASAAATGSDMDFKNLNLSLEQARELVKANAALKEVMTASVKTHVEKQTGKLKEVIAMREARIKELEEQIAELPQAAQDLSGSVADQAARQELGRQLETAQAERAAAIKQAVENAEKKFKVQLSMRDMLNAKVTAIKKIVAETPEKTVKEAWEVAEKARAAPPSVKPSSAAGSAQVQSNATTALPASPSHPQRPVALSSLPSSLPSPSAFAPSNSLPATPSTRHTSTASATNGLPAPVISNASNASNAGTGPAALRSISSGIPVPGAGVAAGASKLPRGGPPSRQASISGPGGLQVQGAAQRGGGAQSGLARGGGFSRGGAGRGISRGGGNAPNAGQKRAHDGATDGGDPKRSRGGGSA